MPPKNRKVADACRAMNCYGISEVETKAVLKDLLKLYDKNWELIVEDDYKVLLEVILDKKTEQESVEHIEKETSIHESKVKSLKKEASSYDKTEAVELPAKRLYTRQQKKQALSLSKFCSDSTPSRKARANDDGDLMSDSSSEEAEPPLRRTSLKHHREEALIRESKGVKGKNKEAPSNDRTEDIELPTKRLCTIKQTKEPLSLSKSCLETTQSRKAHQKYEDLFSDSEESEESQPLLRRTIQRNQEEGALVHSWNPRLAENSNVICLDDSSDSDDCDDTDDADNSELLDVEPLNVDKGDSVSYLSQMDVSSSLPKGEVTVPLLCHSPPQYDFHHSNFDAPVEVESYRNEECFLATGFDSNVDEKTGFGDAPELEYSNAEDVLARKENYQGNNYSAPSSLSESFAFQNLIKIVPHIPKHIVFSGFERLNHINGFTIEDIEKICSESGKKLLVLGGPQSSNLCIVEDAHNHHSSLGVVKSCVYIDDITRGEERVKISLEDGRNVEDLPTFFYIPRNLVYNNAYVKFSLARISDEGCCPHCYGDCLASPIPCICAIETRGGYAYTPGGLVKEKFLEDCISMKREPKEHHYFYCNKCPLESAKDNESSVACKGHLLRKFIKECWSKCGCNKNCGNRIVQQGITAKLQVFLTSEGKGWGLRALEDLPRGAFVCEYVGEIVTNTELYERNMRSAGERHTYPMLLDADWGSESVLKDEEALCLDATVYGNVARFINHRCSDASLVEIPVEVETPDHHYYHVAFFTTRNVAAMEELTWDYGIDFDDRDHPVKAFQCVCGSPFCRGRKV